MLLDCDDDGFIDDVLGEVRRNTGQAVVHGISVALTFCCRAMAARWLSHALDAVSFLRRADERGGDVLGRQSLRTGHSYTPHLQLMSFESATIAM
jgi:hypothetical protein